MIGDLDHHGTEFYVSLLSSKPNKLLTIYLFVFIMNDILIDLMKYFITILCNDNDDHIQLTMMFCQVKY